jgi:hypothetical protein
MQLGAGAVATDEARELRDNVRLTLPGERRYASEPIAPCAVAMAARAMLEVQHHAVRHIGAECRRRLRELRARRHCGHEDDGNQRQAPQCAAASLRIWHDRMAHS